MTTAVPVLLVDDHVLLAQAVQFALRTAGIEASVVAPDSADAVLTAARAVAPATVLLDLRLGVPGGTVLDGLDLVAPLVAAGCTVVVLTAEPAGSVWGTALQRGATTVLAKDAPLDRLVETVLTVRAGGDPLPPGRRQQLLAAARTARADETARWAPFRRLSPREDEVLRRLADGMTTAAIARASFVSESTVRSQIRGVLTKLQATSQLQAVAAARRTGWLDAAGR
ncbi:response regulator [Modestobacter sp. I12A-02628]|uniref:Response regulator transcription factor n=1 Tax=Goekera deserti TaxID=2497753 RepID=A0A7K3WDB0_9ACTN|nr:response regulator transcription factor [Goekera deserti]MPQ96792.1 response regulator [Goekera deserti]NDI46894.1 response regulator [Goekera deserti]NEL54462.1 response regulator transcription factor [Goekera deserti]